MTGSDGGRLEELEVGKEAVDEEGEGKAAADVGDGARRQSGSDGKLVRRAEAAGVVPEMRRCLKLLADLNQVLSPPLRSHNL